MDIQQAITWFCGADEESGNFEHRRYPACIGYLEGVVAIADEDDNGSNLSMFTEEVFVSWMVAAKEFSEKHDESPWSSMWETRPENDEFQSH